MHEFGITQEILSISKNHAEKNGAARVTKVVISVGRMTGVVEDCLRFYWDQLIKDTVVDGAELVVKDIPIRLKCISCGAENEVEDIALTCPSCESFGPEVTAGKELLVDTIEIEKDDGTSADVAAEEAPDTSALGADGVPGPGGPALV